MSDVKFLDGPGTGDGHSSSEAGHADSPNTKAPKNKTLTIIIEGTIVLLACVLGLVIRLAVYETAIVTSDSMLPTLKRSDRLLVDHRSSLHGQWERGDIVIFEPPTSWQDENMVDSYIK
ncbi:MAG: Signal peptidase peptidase, partial [Abditibacteriota bacterium]|nr:Signal peptidase peptidase [Abditibacteriota bacterium]